MEAFDKLAKAVNDARKDVGKVDNGEHAAGTRLRKAMQDIKTAAQEVRDAVMTGRQAKAAQTNESAPLTAPAAQQAKMPVTYRKDDGAIDAIVERMLGKYHSEIAQHDPPPIVDVMIASAIANEGGDGDTDANVLQEHGRPVEATIRILRLKDRAAGRGDVEVTIDGDNWENLNAKEREALIDHQLEHLELQKDSEDAVKTDDLGRPKFKIRKHDYEIGGFTAVAARHHADCPEVRFAKQLMDHSGQMLFGFGPQTGSLSFDAPAKAPATKRGRNGKDAAAASPVAQNAADSEKPGSALHQVKEQLDQQPAMAMAV